MGSVSKQNVDCGEKERTEIITISVDSQLLHKIEEKAKTLGIDVLTFVRWCICTGLMLEDLNVFVKSKWKEE